MKEIGMVLAFVGLVSLLAIQAKAQSPQPRVEREDGAGEGGENSAQRPRPTSLTKIDVPALAAPPAKSNLATILRRGSLKVCVRSDVPPFGYFTSKGLVGFDIHLAKELSVQLGIYYKKTLQVNWQVIEAGERIPKLKKQSCDVVAAAFSYTAARAAQISFSEIYLETDKVAIASKNIVRKVPVIALVRGTTNYAKGLKGAVRYFSNYKEIMQAMKNGEVDLVVADRPMARHMIRSVTKSFGLHKALRQKERYALGVNTKHKYLLQVLNRALRDLAKSGRLSHMVRKWL